MKRENMKEIMEIEQLKRSGRDLILIGLAVTWVMPLVLMGMPRSVDMIAAPAMALCILGGRITIVLGISKYYEAKGQSPWWSLLVFLFGILGAIPYVLMKDVRSPE